MFLAIPYRLLNLLFPALCNACGTELGINEKIVCTHCQFGLPFTDFNIYKENPVARQFWGRVKIEAATAMLYYKKAGKVQRLIHNLKYRNKTNVGIWLGHRLGEHLIGSKYFEKTTLILPVPLHKKKLRARGYNQSTYIAKGVSEMMHIPYKEHILIRLLPTETQTRKSRYKRHENMKDVFNINDIAKITGQQILLVDDVLTTGATLESCAITLLEAGAETVAIATIAYAE